MYLPFPGTSHHRQVPEFLVQRGQSGRASGGESECLECREGFTKIAVMFMGTLSHFFRASFVPVDFSVV